MSSDAPALSVFCLCAAWCGTCREYRPGFHALGESLPGVACHWVDVEDHADALDDLDVENFPTLLIQRGDLVLFLGAMLPDHALLRRLLETYLAQSPDEARRYAAATPERRGWQAYNLQRMLGF